MGEGPSILIEQHGAVRRVILNRPEKLNAMDGEMTAEFFAAIDAAVADPGTHVVVLSGSGRAFCSGADLKAPPAVSRGAADGFGGAGSAISNAPVDMILNRERVAAWLRLWTTPKPLIAQVHGYCLGIANEIAGACDIVVCGEGARFGMPEARDFALPPTLGQWPLRIGPAKTKELLWTGRLVEGDEAVVLGLADQVVADADLAERAMALASRIAEVPAARLAVVKQAVNAWAESSGLREASLRGADYHALYHQVSTFAEQFGGSNPAVAGDGRDV